jgi:hypothetical protein
MWKECVRLGDMGALPNVDSHSAAGPDVDSMIGTGWLMRISLQCFVPIVVSHMRLLTGMQMQTL